MTLLELKRRHETGEKQFKSVKLKIREQLKRQCAVRGCHASLAFKRADVFLCEDHKKIAKTVEEAESTNSKKRVKAKKTKAQIRKENKAKKERYYKKHGIVFNKNIRRDVKLSSVGLPPETELLYENYKEPLKRIPKVEGYGYYGTLAQTKEKTHVQCHLCGNLYPSVGNHLRIHKISAEDYKERFGLALGTALISDTRKEELQQNAVKRFDGKLPKHLIAYNKKVQAGAIKHNPNKREKWTLERRNKEGLCPDQVLEKIKELGTKLGHTPSQDEFRRYYKDRFIGSIKYQHGSYLKAVKKAKLISAKEIKEPDNEKLLQDLVDFHKKHGRIPMSADFNRGMLYPRAMYFRRFGTLNNARVEAGLNAVIPMPFGQILELTPQQYMDYKKGKQVKAKRKEHREI